MPEAEGLITRAIEDDSESAADALAPNSELDLTVGFTGPGGGAVGETAEPRAVKQDPMLS